ncbi:MAG: fibronectin type III-like domain-contianing protein, partial [Actinomycetota bacterium]
EPLWPFGHGGSYTTFEWGAVDLTDEAGTAGVASVEVTNTGDRPGVEVVQVYVEPPPGPLARPARTLAGFGRVELDPGQRAAVTVELPPRAFARWDEPTGAWVVDPGTHVVHAAASSRDLRSSATVDLDGGPT